MPEELRLSDKAVELMAYLSMKGGATEQQIVADVWPAETPERGVERLAEAVAEVNRAATAATANPSPAIFGPGQDPADVARAGPRLLVRVLGRPRVDVYQDGEPYP